jgi:hypothetical protein
MPEAAREPDATQQEGQKVVGRKKAGAGPGDEGVASPGARGARDPVEGKFQAGRRSLAKK